LSRVNLIDEYVLWIHPVVLGKGRPLFKLSGQLRLELIKTKTFRTGVVVVCYKVLK
jgi:dihydrofolate reductase